MLIVVLQYTNHKETINTQRSVILYVVSESGFKQISWGYNVYNENRIMCKQQLRKRVYVT